MFQESEFVDVDAEILVNEPDVEEDSFVSFTDLVEEEFNQHDDDIKDIDDVDMSVPVTNSEEAELSLVAFESLELVESFRKEGINSSNVVKLDQSITALLDLLLYYGNVEALDQLLSLINELDMTELIEPLNRVVIGLADVVSYERLPLRNEESLSEPPKQLTIELQSQILDFLSDELDQDINVVEPIVTSFNENSNFSNDNRLNSLNP